MSIYYSTFIQWCLKMNLISFIITFVINYYYYFNSAYVGRTVLQATI